MTQPIGPIGYLSGAKEGWSLLSRSRLFSPFCFRRPTLRLPPGDSPALQVCFASLALYSNTMLLAHALLL